MVESWKIFEYWLPKLAALLSLFGSSMIVAEIYKDWQTKRYSRQGLNAVSRALLSMSIGDVFFSFAWFMASWVVSQSEQGVESYEASQTSGACKFQGFLVQFGFFASITFNASLAIIYLLMVRYHWTNQQISQRFNVVAVVLWSLALVFAIVPAAYNLYHDIGENCWLSAPPSDLPQCQEEESFYAHPECIERTDITNLLMGMQILPVWICIILNARIMYVIYRETRRMERGEMLGASSRRSTPSQTKAKADIVEIMDKAKANPQDDGDAAQEQAASNAENKVVPGWRRQPDEDVQPAVIPFDEFGRPVQQQQPAATPEKKPVRPSWRRQADEEVPPAVTAFDDLGRPINPTPQKDNEAKNTPKEGPGLLASLGDSLRKLTIKKEDLVDEEDPDHVQVEQNEADMHTAKSFFGWKSSTQEQESRVEPEPEPEQEPEASSSSTSPRTPLRMPSQCESESQQPMPPVRFDETKVMHQLDQEASDSYEESVEAPRTGANRSSLDQSTLSQSGRRSRTVGVQGLWYIGGFFFTYLPGTISVLVFVVSGQWSTPLYRASLTFLALQGAWNFVVFCKGRREMKTAVGSKVKTLLFDKICCCQCIPKSMVPPSPGVSMLTPQTSRVSNKGNKGVGKNSGTGDESTLKGSSRNLRSDNSSNRGGCIRSDVSTEIHANKRSVNFTSNFSNASTVQAGNLNRTTVASGLSMISIAEDDVDESEQLDLEGNAPQDTMMDMAILDSYRQEMKEAAATNSRPVSGLSEMSVCSDDQSNGSSDSGVGVVEPHEAGVATLEAPTNNQQELAINKEPVEFDI